MAKPKQLQSIADLTPDIANVNKGSERGAYMLDWSLTNLGAGRSILADADGNVIAGNKTLEAAVDHQLPIRVVQTDGKELVVVQRTDLRLLGKGKEQTTARQLAVADNRASEVGYVADAEVLLSHAQSVDLSPMFREDELKELLDSLTPAIEPGGGGDEFDTTPEEGPTRCQLGDLWVIGGKHRLLCGDSTKAKDVTRLMGGEKANAVVTDPPYGINQDGVTNDEPEKLRGLVEGVIRWLPLTNGILVAFQSTRTFPLWLDEIRRQGFEFERMLWLYKEAQCTFPWRGWILKSESILVSTKGSDPHWNEVHPYSHDCYKLSEVSHEIPDGMGWHGSVKPLAVLRDVVGRVSWDGDAIYDPFLGSGTTLIAAHRENRTCYGLEIEPKYCDVILKRAEAEGLSAEKVVNG